jgi:hypothetical protein
MTLLDARAPQGSNEVGEDTWELFEAIEQSFGVNLGDYLDLAGISVLELSQRIDQAASYPTESSCLSSVAFYRLRRAFQTVAKTPRSMLRPGARIEELLPTRNRHLQWESLQSELGLELPKLHLPGWLLLLSIVLPVFLLTSIRLFSGIRISGAMIAIGSFVLIFFALRAAMLYPVREVPRSCETLGDLAQAMLAKNYKYFADNYGSSPERGIYPALRILIAMQTGINIDEVLPETRIPSDLDIY